MRKGFTLVDVLVGISLMLILFLGIFGAFQLGLKTVGLTKAKITATSLANQKLEEVRNLPYAEIGIEGIDEGGGISGFEYYPEESQEYLIETEVFCRNNPADGSQDACLCDYKTVAVSVSWSFSFPGEINLATDVAPKNDIQECEKAGGVLEVNVFDAQGLGVGSIEVEVENVNTGNQDYCVTDAGGLCHGEKGIFLASSTEPEDYKVTVPSPGTSLEYSAQQTFRSGDVYDSTTIANPENPNATIFNGQITEASFSIDRLGAFAVEVYSSRGRKVFEDEFDNDDKISSSASVQISDGEAKLAKSNGDYFPSGFLISNDIQSSSELKGWQRFQWIDSFPEGTDIKYHLFYASGTDWLLIPDSDLSGNSSGLGPSPVDLSGLDPDRYLALRAKAEFSTTDLTVTPELSEWQISHFTREAYPVDGASFNLRGEKIVGTDSSEDPIYKYSSTRHIINQSGTIHDLEWDTYKFSDFEVSDVSLELEEAVPGQMQPDGSLLLNLSPDITQSLTLYLAAENTLLVSVKDAESLLPVFGADVRIYNSVLGYNKTQQTNSDGQTFFIPLEEDLYNIEVTAEGYSYLGGQIFVSGANSTTTYLNLDPQ